MRLSVENSTLSSRFGDMRAIDMIKQAGFDAMDYSFYDREPDHPMLGDGYKEYAMELRKYLDQNNLVCNQAHAPLGFMRYGYKFDVSEPRYLAIVRSIEAAAILGASNIIVHGLWEFDMNGMDDKEIVEYNIRYYKSLIPYCEKNGICVAVENLMRPDVKCKCYRKSVASTPEALRYIVETIASPWIVGCVDVGHATLMGVDPEDFISKLDKNILKALHIQDTDFVDDKHTLPFVGDISWDAVMRSLKKIDYKGDLTFEIVEYFNKFPDALLADALKVAAAVGRYLISKFES